MASLEQRGSGGPPLPEEGLPPLRAEGVLFPGMGSTSLCPEVVINHCSPRASGRVQHSPPLSAACWKVSPVLELMWDKPAVSFPRVCVRELENPPSLQRAPSLRPFAIPDFSTHDPSLSLKVSKIHRTRRSDSMRAPYTHEETWVDKVLSGSPSG